MIEKTNILIPTTKTMEVQICPICGGVPNAEDFGKTFRSFDGDVAHVENIILQCGRCGLSANIEYWNFIRIEKEGV